MLACGIQVKVLLYYLVVLGSSRKWINVLRRPLCLFSNHRALPSIDSGGAPACPNSNVTLTCISKSASLTWSTTCNGSLRSVSYVERFPVQTNLKLCNNKEAWPTVVVHNDTTIEMILTLMASSSLNGTALECYSEDASSEAWATILVLG